MLREETGMMPARISAGVCRTIVVILLVSMVFAADKFPDYPVHPAGEYAVTSERGGVTIGVQPVEDLDDQKTYFDAKLTPQGFIPVFVVIQNGSADTVLFDESNVGYGGAFYGFSPDRGLTKIQENIVKRRIKSQTLSPGSSVHGFLYIPVPKKGPREKIHLQVPITKAGTSQTFVLNLLF
jgi:hypothetical protein